MSAQYGPAKVIKKVAQQKTGQSMQILRSERTLCTAGQGALSILRGRHMLWPKDSFRLSCCSLPQHYPLLLLDL